MFDDFVCLLNSKLTGLAEIAAGRLCIVQVDKGQCAVEVGFRHPWLIPDGQRKILDSPAVILQPHFYIGPVKIRNGIIRLQPDNPVVVGDSRLVIG